MQLIFRLLTDCGYNVVQRPGFSSFRIDLAVVNEAGDFVLGIMCDGQMYKSAGNVRERERLRNTILEEMGWKIYKVWSYEWLKNPVGCKDELIEAVEEVGEVGFFDGGAVILDGDLVFCKGNDDGVIRIFDGVVEENIENLFEIRAV